METMKGEAMESQRIQSGHGIVWTAISFAAALIVVVSGGRGQATDIKASSVNLDSILKKLSNYEYGQDENVLWSLRNYVHAVKDKPDERAACEARLIFFLDSKATLAGRDAVCRELRIIGTGDSVPILEKMLLAKETTDMARYALGKIPGSRPDKALLRALDRGPADIKMGIISTLGQRKSPEAVPALGRLLGNRDSGLAAAAATSLGMIGGPEASKFLLQSLSSPGKKIKESVISALLLSAEGLIAAKNPGEAARIYDRILTEETPDSLRGAALRGRISTSGDRAQTLILESLASPDARLHEPAISMIASAFDASSISRICSLLPTLGEKDAEQVLAVLAGYPGENVLSAVMESARSPEISVRIAALRALERIGDESSASFLAQTAARTTGGEREASRTALWGLKGKNTDEVITALLESSPDEDIQAELIQAIGERRIFAGKSLIMSFADSPALKVRTQVVRSMRTLGTPSDVSGMLDLLFRSEDEIERADIERTIVGLAQKISKPDERGRTVKARLDQEKDQKKRIALISVLGKIGDDSTLAALREALHDPDPEIVDAAVRALAGWPTASAADDAFGIARSSSNARHQILALRGYIRMVGLEKYRAPESAVRDLAQALTLATRPEEKRLVLSELPTFSSPEALRLAESLLGDPSVQAEARAAIEKIKDKIKSKK
jgi:HEAT repeat protein